MPRSVQRFLTFEVARTTKCLAVLVTICCAMSCALAQNVPLLSGGAGFFTSTSGGKTSYLPITEPLLAAPVGDHFLFESRATLLEVWSPIGGGQPGYDHSHLIGLTYMQGDYIASPHLTIIGGSYLTPFGTFNERLSPIWIGNFQDGPMIVGLGTMGTGTGLGGQVRGSVISRAKYSLTYAAYYSTRSGNMQFSSDRSAGGQASLYLPEQHLEIGASYGRLLQGTHENFYGTHVWWEPKDAGLRLRSEFASGQHAYGYWVETDYRNSSFRGLDSWVGRIEPVFRIQQSFRHDTIASDGLPAVNTQRADFGLDYNLPHNTRIITSFARQFASTGDHNTWETGIVYRFLTPAWKGKSQ